MLLSAPWRFFCAAIPTLLCLISLPGQDPAAQALNAWLGPYLRGDVKLAKQGQVQAAELTRLQGLARACRRNANRESVAALLRLASAEPRFPGGRNPWDKANFAGEVRVQQVRGIAVTALVEMEAAFLDAELLAVCQNKDSGTKAELRRAAALRVLAQRDAPKAREALLRATRGFRPAQRVAAVRALAQASSPTLVPLLFDLLRDREIFVRIASIHGIGQGLADEVDETVHDEIPAAIASLRDKAIKQLGQALQRDKVWQVRAAALEALLSLRCKAVIPVLINGLKAELRRKNEPWGMLRRIHRGLEGLTGQKIPGGNPRLWEQFWKQEGPTFRFRAAAAKTAESQKNSRYDKFFNLQLETNRVLFIVDLSGSMVEKIKLKTKGVGTVVGGAGQTSTKAALVIAELKKMALSLRDGDMFNIIVFGNEAKLWKSDARGRPALTKMNDELRDELLGSYLDNLRPAGMTNLYGALKLAMGLGGRGLYDKYYGLGYDTIYLLSDGAPTAGEVTDPKQILRMVREANVLRRLKIHTITFGDLNQLRFLKTLAAENGGEHVHIE